MGKGRPVQAVAVIYQGESFYETVEPLVAQLLREKIQKEMPGWSPIGGVYYCRPAEQDIPDRLKPAARRLMHQLRDSERPARIILCTMWARKRPEQRKGVD
jgi:hypothetical protein